LPGLWQTAALPPLAQVRTSAADAFGAAAIAAAIAPPASAGAIKRSLIDILTFPYIVLHPEYVVQLCDCFTVSTLGTGVSHVLRFIANPNEGQSTAVWRLFSLVYKVIHIKSRCCEHEVQIMRPGSWQGARVTLRSVRPRNSRYSNMNQRHLCVVNDCLATADAAQIPSGLVTAPGAYEPIPVIPQYRKANWCGSVELLAAQRRGTST
jgi:hypothetical protein